jgi:hypothetical protein
MNVTDAQAQDFVAKSELLLTILEAFAQCFYSTTHYPKCLMFSAGLQYQNNLSFVPTAVQYSLL